MNAIVSNAEQIRNTHFYCGLPPDIPCSQHSPLLHLLGDPEEYEASLAMPSTRRTKVNTETEVSTNLERITALEARVRRMKAALHQVVAFANSLEERIVALEGRSKQ